MNPRKIGTVVVVIFLLSTLVFIFSNSLLPVALSKEKSLGVMGTSKNVKFPLAYHTPPKNQGDFAKKCMNLS